MGIGKIINKLKKPKEDDRPVDEAKDGATLSDFKKGMAIGDRREEALFNLCDMLFDEDKILMIARLDPTLGYYMVKHIVLKQFFYYFYIDCSIKIKIVSKIKYPYYKQVVKIKYPGDKAIRDCYDIFLKDLLKITISFGGGGRKEIIEIIKSLHDDIGEEDKQGLLKRLF